MNSFDLGQDPDNRIGDSDKYPDFYYRMLILSLTKEGSITADGRNCDDLQKEGQNVTFVFGSYFSLVFCRGVTGI